MSDYARMRNKCGAVAFQLRRLAEKNRTVGPKLLVLAEVLEKNTPALDDVVDLEKRVDAARKTEAA